MPILNWIQIAGGAVAAFALSWLLHTVDVNIIEKRHAAAIEAQKTADIQQCNIDKQITRQANDNLQKDRDDITRKYDDLRMHKPMRCVVPSKPSELSSGGVGYARQNGISPDWLRGYAAECEVYRRSVVTCVAFLGSERSR